MTNQSEAFEVVFIRIAIPSVNDKCVLISLFTADVAKWTISQDEPLEELLPLVCGHAAHGFTPVVS